MSVARRTYYRNSRGEVKALSLGTFFAVVAGFGVAYLAILATIAAVITLVVKAII